MDHPAPRRRLELVPIDELADDPRNPKGHDEESLDRSIGELGYIEPIVEDERTGLLISGHGRKGSLVRRRESGMPAPDGVEVVDGVWHAWVVRGWSSRDDDHAATALVALNNIGARGGWIPEKVASLLDDVDNDPGLLDLMAWDRSELDGLLTKARASDAVDVDDDPIDPVEDLPAISEAGDVWTLGPHRLVVGDSTDPAVVALALDGARADLVFTDPPYGIAYRGVDGSRRAIANDDLDPDALRAFLRSTLTCALTGSRPGAAWFVCAPSGPLQVQFGIVLLELGIYRQTIVWLKDRHVLSRGDYHHRTEMIFGGWAPGADPYQPPAPDDGVDFLLYGWAPGAAHTGPPDRLQTDVWEVERALRNHCVHGEVDRGAGEQGRAGPAECRARPAQRSTPPATCPSGSVPRETSATGGYRRRTSRREVRRRRSSHRGRAPGGLTPGPVLWSSTDMPSPAAPARRKLPIADAGELNEADLSAGRAHVTVFVAPDVTVTGELGSALPVLVDRIELRLVSLTERIPFRVTVADGTPVEVTVR